VKKTAVVILAIVALAATGCKKKEEAPKVMPPGGMQGQQMPAVPPGTDPHAGLKPQEIPAGVGHKGKVVSTMNSGGYTYVEVDEKGAKLWVAVMETKVKAGDTVEFPDSPPMINFQSKSLKRTFDKIIFAPGIRVSQ
jgi:major membrane immunogen (membrane-anchored lipoprotein)